MVFYQALHGCNVQGFLNPESQNKRIINYRWRTRKLLYNPQIPRWGVAARQRDAQSSIRTQVPAVQQKARPSPRKNLWRWSFLLSLKYQYLEVKT
jgi:hypothetical protein